MDLSILIPARGEMFLAKTIENILENIEGNTEIIAVCDGNWPDPPVQDHPKITLIYHSQSIGQRAATNEAAKLSRAKFIMKCDAHCSFDKGFDVKLMADCEYDWTIVPRMYNLHAFNWKCKKCGDERYQGPTPTSCPKCDNKTEFERVILWKEKRNPQSDFFRFDKELHFQYARNFKDRPEAKGDLSPTMSLLGACWMMHRQRFWDLDGCDEETGSWGQQGTEVACKTWLSGGKLLVNKKTWFSHMFRTQGGDFGFPYPNPGIKKARKRSQYLWIGNNWPKQIYPLSWLVEKFWPVEGWNNEDLVKIKNIPFRIVDPLTNLTLPHPLVEGFGINGNRKEMSPNTMGFSSIDSGGSIRSGEILGIRGEAKVEGITARPIVADNMVKDENMFISPIGDRRNEPSIHETMNQNIFSKVGDLSVTTTNFLASPQPASSGEVDSNLGKDSMNISCGKVGNDKIIGIDHDSSSSDELRLGTGRCDEHRPIPNILSKNKGIVKGLLYYTDNRLDDRIMNIVQKNLSYSCNGYRIVSVSLKPINFGENIVLPLNRGHLTMAKQQLAGLEALNTDIVFFVEHDVIYPACHFDFTPPKKDVFYYNLNWWKVRTSDGQALHFKAKQVSGLCAYRNILIDYYRNRVKMIESGEIGGRRHFEPGTHYRDAYNKLTNCGFDTWFSEIPYVDIRHKNVVTRNIFDPSGYRGQVTDWTMADEVPFWGRTKGRFNEFLEEALNVGQTL